MLCCVFSITTTVAFANKTPPPPAPYAAKTLGGQPGLPLDDYLLQLLFLGVLLGIYFLKRKKSSI